uniref:RUN domain-containing protein n=1 Tax=Eptatretus burgeri TaxID=7764 RepID=A0A8C4NEK8_EPTBU
MRDTGLFSPMANLQRSSPTSPDEVKQGIMQSLKMAANSLSHNHVALGHTITSSDTHANALCNAVEAVFVHGLRPQYIRRVQATRRHRRKKGHTLPRPVFWQVIRAVTHRDVLAQLGGLRCITTDVGRCRAWLRVALNDGLLECYLASLLVDPISLAEFYWSSGLLLDPECSAQLQTLVQGLSGLPFHLSANASMLNEWTTTPLSLAGLCIVRHSGAVSLEAAPRRAVSCSNVTSLADSFQGYDVSGVPPAGPGRSYSLYEGLAANIENDGGILDKTAGLVYESSSFCGSQGDGSYGSELSSNTDGLSLPEDLIMDLVSPAQSSDQQEKLPLEHGFCNNADIAPQRNNINERTYVEKLEIAVSESSSFASSLALSLPRSSLLSAGDGYQPEFSASVSPASEAEEAFPLPDTEDQHPTNELTSFTRSRFRKVSGVHYQGVGGEDTFICKSIATQKMAPARIYSSRKHPSTSSDSPVVDKLDGAPVLETCILTSPTNNGHRDLFGSEEDIYRLSQEADITFLDVGHKDLPLSGLPGSMNATSRHDASVGTSSPPLLKEVKVIHKRKAGVHTPFPNVLKMGTLEKRSRAVALWREYLAVLSPMFLQLYQPGQEFEGRPVEVHAIALCQVFE